MSNARDIASVGDGRYTAGSFTFENTVVIEDEGPYFDIIDTDPALPANTRRWRIHTFSQDFRINAYKDDGSWLSECFRIFRNELGAQDFRAVLNGGNADTLPATSSLVTRERGDARYVQLTDRFESGDINIVSGTEVNVPHGKGTAPVNIWGYIRCVTAEQGYSAGERIFIGNGNGSYPGDAKVNTLFGGSVNLRVRFSNTTSCFTAADGTTGARADLTNANWKLVLFGQW